MPKKKSGKKAAPAGEPSPSSAAAPSPRPVLTRGKVTADTMPEDPQSFRNSLPAGFQLSACEEEALKDWEEKHNDLKEKQKDYEEKLKIMKRTEAKLEYEHWLQREQKKQVESDKVWQWISGLGTVGGVTTEEMLELRELGRSRIIRR